MDSKGVEPKADRKEAVMPPKVGSPAYIDQNSMNWNEDTLNNFFWPVDVQEILKIGPPSTLKADYFGWHFEKRMGLFFLSEALTG